VVVVPVEAAATVVELENSCLKQNVRAHCTLCQTKCQGTLYTTSNKMSGHTVHYVKQNVRAHCTLCQTICALSLICGNKMPTRCNKGFYRKSCLLAQHVSDTTTPIIRSSRVLYNGYCLWYFVLWFSSCWSGVELRVVCPVCRMQLHTRPAT